MKKVADIDTYIADFPQEVQALLQTIRTTVRAEVPDATEAIAYDMPTFKLDGRNLVYFAAFKQHIGFYPAPTGVKEFARDLSGYKTGKGSVQFPLDQPLPLALIKRMIHHEVKRHAGKGKG